MEIFLYILAFWIGVLFGFLIKGWLNAKFREYSGTITVSTNDLEEKTLYSLELNDYPETLQFKKEVVFKVDSSAESSDRT
jgi:hypothetical protein